MVPCKIREESVMKSLTERTVVTDGSYAVMFSTMFNVTPVFFADISFTFFLSFFFATRVIILFYFLYVFFSSDPIKAQYVENY